MPKRSIRTPTPVEHENSLKFEINTVRDFVTFIEAGDVQRVTLESASIYRSKILSDHGSQFTIYTGDGIMLYEKPAVVVKCAKLRLPQEAQPTTDKQRNLSASLLKEIKVLTHASLRAHPNIVQLFWYDLVEESNRVFTPALIMEQAVSGSLFDCLNAPKNLLSHEAKRSLCLDVCYGLLALHQASVVHGDIKSDNVLVFQSPANPAEKIAKLTDFGSIISTIRLDVGGYPRYYGTPTTNAPEVGDQATIGGLDAIGLVRCDNYSLGLLMFQIITGDRDEAVTRKDSGVLERALNQLVQASLPDQVIGMFRRVFMHLLTYKPSDRCYDLSIIINLLQPLKTEDLSLEKYGICPKNLFLPLPSHWLTKNSLQIQRGNNNSHKKRDIPVFMKSLFGEPQYLDFNVDQDGEVERYTQNAVFQKLLQEKESRKASISGRASFQLAIAAAMGYGTKANISSMLEYALESARKGYCPAQAVVTAWFIAAKEPMPVSEEKQLDWLFEAAAWGSALASTCLRRLHPEQFAEARMQFHRSGGYNQYFYHQKSPEYIGSDEFSKSLDLSYYENNQEELDALAESAAVYGDAILMKHLIQEFGLDPTLTNRWGESLVLLCCKGGHLDVLEVLAHAQGSASQRDSKGNRVRESPIHWLIAFDGEQILAASKLLAEICDLSDLEDPDISWNHPSIDLPGRFPLGSPLHFAVYFNNHTCMKALLEDFSIPINVTGSSEINPLEFAVSRRKVDIAELLIAKGALSDLSNSSLILSEIGMQLPHETMAVTGTTQISPTALTERCLDAVLAQRPELLDGEAGEDWTPLMGAVQFHDRETVKALIDRGCDVNRATSEALEGKTALHLITEKKLYYQEDDILNLLWEAGADFSAHTLVGGKLVLHFAARDDCSSIAAQLLDEPRYCTDINATTLSYGETALHIAAFSGSYSVAQLLLERGANTEIGHVKGTYHERNWDRLTPLAVAASRLRNDMVKLLLDSGASPFARPSSNHTVFHLAVTERDCRMLEMLLKVPNLVSADVDVLNISAGNGMTALHLCAGNLGRHEHLALLLDAGADVSILTHTGHSALDIAYQTRDILRRLLGDSNVEIEELDGKEEVDATEFLFWDSILVPNAVTKIDGITLSVAKISPQDGDLERVENDEQDDERDERDEEQDEKLDEEEDENSGYDSDQASNPKRSFQKFQFDAVEELQRWDSTMKRLEARGGTRSCSDRFARNLLFLVPADVHSDGAHSIQVDVQDD